MGFIKPSKRYRAPHARRLKKGEESKKALFYKTKKIVNKKILRELESFTENPALFLSKFSMQTWPMLTCGSGSSHIKSQQLVLLCPCRIQKRNK